MEQEQNVIRPPGYVEIQAEGEMTAVDKDGNVEVTADPDAQVQWWAAEHVRAYQSYFGRKQPEQQQQ